MIRFDEHVASRLANLRSAGLLRDPLVSDVPSGTHVQVAGRRLLNLCSNNYLGLADDPRVLASLARASADWGSASASRLITGSLRPHRDAESTLARHVGLPDARLFSSGYAANVGALSALLGPGDLVFSDALNHASLIDGCRLSRARVVIYPHRDVDALARLLRAHRPEGRAALVLTDAVFSMDGDLAPLAELSSLAREHAAGLFVDEAHSLGVLGPRGAGLAAAVGVVPDVVTGMLGKAFGLAGGFVAGAEPLLRLLESTARSYVFSTGVHAALAAVIPGLVDLVAASDDARARVLRHRATLAARLAPFLAPGLDEGAPILPVVVGESARALRLADALFERGLFVRGIRPPTVAPGTARLRLVPIATHSDEDIAWAADLLVEELSR